MIGCSEATWSAFIVVGVCIVVCGRWSYLLSGVMRAGECQAAYLRLRIFKMGISRVW